jgi:hypothetical protein
MNRRGPKLTEAQRTELLTVYMENGFEAAKPLALSLGVLPRYVAALARSRGHTNNYHRRPNPKAVVMFKDPRWARAVAIGPVSA